MPAFLTTRGTARIGVQRFGRRTVSHPSGIARRADKRTHKRSFADSKCNVGDIKAFTGARSTGVRSHDHGCHRIIRLVSTNLAARGNGIPALTIFQTRIEKTASPRRVWSMMLRIPKGKNWRKAQLLDEHG